MLTSTVTAADYDRVFADECRQVYPVIDALEQECGYAIDRVKLENAARVLACPVKKNPPNWQHGRVVYAVARQYFETMPEREWISTVDIGTAKGFSALCAQWALNDSGRNGKVASVDVIDPKGTDLRNTVAELDGPVTLAQILEPWAEASSIYFAKSTGIDFLRITEGRIHFAFVDGKHAGDIVTRESRMISARQQSGDVIVFDDAHIPAIAEAIAPLHQIYALQTISVKSERAYVIARRR